VVRVPRKLQRTMRIKFLILNIVCFSRISAQHNLVIDLVDVKDSFSHGIHGYADQNGNGLFYSLSYGKKHGLELLYYNNLSVYCVEYNNALPVRVHYQNPNLYLFKFQKLIDGNGILISFLTNFYNVRMDAKQNLNFSYMIETYKDGLAYGPAFTLEKNPVDDTFICSNLWYHKTEKLIYDTIRKPVPSYLDSTESMVIEFIPQKHNLFSAYFDGIYQLTYHVNGKSYEKRFFSRDALPPLLLRIFGTIKQINMPNLNKDQLLRKVDKQCRLFYLSLSD
jgi:hypothetical protein